MSNKSESWTKLQVLNTIVGLLAGSQSLFLLYYSIKSDWTPTSELTVALLAILNCALIFITYRTIINHHNDNKDNSVLNIRNSNQKIEIEKLENLLITSNSNNSKTAIIVHNICHEFRRILYYFLYKTDDADELQILSIQSSFKKYLMFLLSNTKEIFDIITGDECSVCIKLFYDNKEIKTFMRDSVSYRSRNESDVLLPSFEGSRNTAFNIITSREFSDTYFVCDNLNEDKNYMNANPKWKTLYNATIVTPIRISLPSKENPEEMDSYVIGFLCVDNMKGNFDNDVCINILSAIGDLIFHLFNIYVDLDLTLDNQPEAD